MDLFIFLVGFVGIIVALVMLIINFIKKKPKKKPVITLIVCFILMIVGISMPTADVDDVHNPDSGIAMNETPGPTPDTTPDPTPEVTPDPTPEPVRLTEEEIEILEKSYADLTDEEIIQIGTIASNSNNLIEDDYILYSENIMRLDKELAEIAWAEHVEENTKELIAGQHIVGQHIAKGRYDVTFIGSGNFTINSNSGELLTNEIGGSSRYAIDKYRAILIDEAVIELSGVKAKFTPAKEITIPYEEFEIYSGIWIVGQDITEGRYLVTPTDGNGNFVVYGSNGRLKTNEILGGNYGVDEVVINVEDGDMIDIGGINKVGFKPEK